jgi:hypothetical protein
MFQGFDSMSPIELILLLLLLVLCCAAKAGVDAAYRNGCNDGYGFAKDHNHPGYRRAGKLIADNWPEIKRRLKEEKPQDWQ